MLRRLGAAVDRAHLRNGATPVWPAARTSAFVTRHNHRPMRGPRRATQARRKRGEPLTSPEPDCLGTRRQVSKAPAPSYKWTLVHLPPLILSTSPAIASNRFQEFLGRELALSLSIQKKRPNRRARKANPKIDPLTIFLDIVRSFKVIILKIYLFFFGLSN